VNRRVVCSAEPNDIQRLVVVFVMAFAALRSANAARHFLQLSGAHSVVYGISGDGLFGVSGAILALSLHRGLSVRVVAPTTGLGGKAQPFWGSTAAAIIGVDLLKIFRAMLGHVAFRACFALAEMSVAHHRVSVERRERLRLAALEAGFHAASLSRLRTF